MRWRTSVCRFSGSSSVASISSWKRFYSGIPSTTPAVQGEIFFGVKTAVPSFQFLRRKSGKDFRMYDAAAAMEIEDELLESCPQPLLQGGTAYSNIFRGGARHTHYCSRDMAPQEILRRMNPFTWLFIAIVYAPRFSGCLL
jgi:hypothetical protein